MNSKRILLITILLGGLANGIALAQVNPVLDTILPQSVNEGQTLQFRVHATDANGDPITLTAQNLPATNASFVDSTNGAGSFTFSPDFTQAGVYNVSFIATDTTARADTMVVAITVNNVNRPPVLALIGPKSVNEGQTLSFRFSATDPDGTIPSFTVLNNPTNSSFVDSANGAGSFTFSPNFTQAGTYNVTFIASDGSLADSEIVTITVNNVNRPPVLDTILPQSVNEGQSLSFRVHATDPDGTIPAFSVVNNPLNSSLTDSLNGAGSFTFNPDFTQAGVYNVTFIASDGSLADSQVVQITVNNVNQAPVLALIGPKSVNEGQTLSFRFSATDPDGTIPTFSIVNKPAAAVFTDSGNGAGSFVWTTTFADSGVYTPTFIASDGSLADSEVVTITVNNVNRAPVLAAIGAKSVNEGQTLSFRISATDPDGTTPTFTIVNKPTNAVFTDSGNGAGSLVWTTNFAEAGVYTPTFIASDGSLADSEVVTITVNNVNRAPVLAAIGAKSVNEGQTLSFRISATDPDGTIPTFSIVNKPAAAVFTDSGNGAGSLVWTTTFADSGVYTPTFIASDGSLADSEVVTITVNNVNRAPVLALIGPKSVNEGQTLTFRFSATDPDGTTPTFTILNKPTNAVFTDSGNGAGSLVWTTSFSDSGVYTPTFIASDGSLADSEIVTITVNNVNRAPVLALIGPKSVNEGQTLTFRFSATDPDGTTPGFTVLNNPTNSSFVDSANGAGSFTFNPDFTQANVYNVTFIASDGSLADTEIVAITVNNVNRPPVLAAIGAKSVNEGQSLVFRISATDPDGTTPSFSVVNNPANSSLVDSANGAGSFTFNPNFTQAGTYNVTFIASDGSLADSEIVVITVNNVNQAPVLAAIGPKSVTEGQTLSFRFSATDPDGTIPSFTVVNNPTNSTFVDSANGAGSFTFNPAFTQAGTYNVTFIASDGSLTDSEIVTITVNEAGNQRPILAAIGTKIVTEGQTLQFRVSATDPDGTFPALIVVNNPANSGLVDSANGAGSFTFTPSFTQAGLYNVIFIASDGTLADSEFVSIIVNESGNQRPVLDSIGPKTVQEGQILQFRVHATDPDGTIPSLTVVNNPTNSSFVDSTNGAGSFTFSPNFTQAGVYNVRFIASDGTLADTEIVAITVTDAGNQRPVLAPIGPKSVTEGQVLSFRISATDADGTIPSFTVVNNPTNSNLIDSLNGAGSFTFSPSFTQAGVYNVTFIASDGSLADSEIVTITVNEAGNQRPVLAAIGPKSVTEGQTLQFRFSATDPDGTIPSFAVVNNPTNSSFVDSANGAGSFTFSPNFTQAGTYNVTFIASDGILADSEIVTITVINAGNQRPVLATIGPKSVTEGQTLQFRISATDPDGTIPSFLVVNNPTNSSLVDSANGAGSFTFNPSFTQAGVYNVTFIATDGSLADSEIVTITVNDAGNQRPVLAAIGPKSVTEGQTLSFRFSATDPDGTIPSFTVVNKPANSNLVDSLNGAGSFTFSPNFTQAGIYNVTFIASDGSLADSEIVTITVIDAGNQRPVLAAIGPKSVTEGQTLSFRFSATDPDGTIPSLTVVNNPLNSSFVDSTNGAGSFTFNPSFTQAGTYNVTFIASDGSLADSEVVTVTVINAGNQAPVLATIGPKTVTEGQTLQFRISATDPDGTFPSFLVVNNPTNSSLVDSANGAGSFTFNPSFTQAGVYNITFIATDGSLADSEIVTITVNEAGNQRPVLATIGAKSVTEGQTLQFRFSATDPDGTIPSFTVVNNPTNSSFVDSTNGAGSFTFSPSFTQAGTYNVTFIASDGSLADSEIVTITVNESGNQRPVLATIGAKSVTEGQTLSFRISATDPDGTFPSFVVVNNPTNSSLVDSTNGAGSFTFNPSFTQAGIYNVTFIASDGVLADSEIVTITVINAGNQRPVLATIGPKSVTEGQTLSFRFSATDPDGTIPSLTVVNNPANSSLVDSTNGAGSFTFSPSFTQAGVYNVTFIASDGSLADSEIVTITVNDAGNQRPVLATIGAKSVTEGQTLQFRFSATDPDGTIPSLTVVNNPANSSLVDSTNGAGSFTFSPSFTQAGVYNVTFIASDGSLADSEIVTITVNDAGNQRPVLAAIGPKSVSEGQTLVFRISATDTDGTFPNFTVINNPANSGLIDSLNGAGSFSFTPNFTQAGVYNVTFIASDGSLADSEIVTITVTEVNQAPVLATIGPKSVTEGQTLSFRFSAADPDGTIPSLNVVNSPTNSSFVDSTNGAGSFTFNPNFTQAGTYNVTFIASDGSLADSEIVTITVNEAGNQRPVLDSIGPKTVQEGQTLQFRVHATDLDGTIPGLAVVNNPANSGLIDSLNGAGSFRFTPNFAQAGVYNVTFIASDGSLADSEAVVITVTEAGNQAPILDSIGPRTVTEGQNLTFKVHATDPEGTIPSLFATNLPANSNFIDSLNGSGAFVFNPNFTQAGTYNIKFFATDGTLVDSEIVQITVVNVNQPPVLDSIGPKTIAEGSNLNFRVTAHDVDGNSNLFLSALNLPANATFVDSGNGIGRFNFNPDFTQSGVYNVTFKVTDLFFTDSEIVQITVTEGANRAPVLDPIGYKIITEGNLLQFRVHATDPDGTIPILSVSSPPRGAAFVDSGNGSGSFSWTPDFAQAGLYNITFTASDGKAKDQENVLVQVKEAGNQRPVLFSIGPRSVTEGQVLTFKVAAADPDSTIPNLFVDSLPRNATFIDSSNGNGSFSFSPNFIQAGTYNVLFRASDGSLADSELVTITVIEAGNQAPQWVTLPDSFVISENVSGGFNVAATDPDSTIPRLRATNLPLNASFVDSTNGRGRFSIAPDFTQAGTYFVRFFAKDAADTTVFGYDSVKVVIKDTNRKPVFTQGLISDQTLNEGDSIQINLSATDPDGTIPVLGFLARTSPTGAIINLANAAVTNLGGGNGQFKFKPDFSQSGVYYITFTAADQVYPADTTFLVPQVKITVNNVNRPPVLQPLPDTSVREGDSLVLLAVASDPEQPPFPVVTAYNLPANAKFTTNNNGTGRLVFKPAFNQAGLYTIGIVASDGSLADSDLVNITVIESGNHAPRFVTSFPDSMLFVTGRLDSFPVLAADPDSTIPTLTATGLPGGAASFESTGPGRSTFYFTPADSQMDKVYLVQITVTDGSLQATDTLKVRVLGFLRGDVNRDLKITLVDVIYLVNYIFRSGPAPQPLESGDVNKNGTVSLADVIYLVNYILKGGPAPPP